MTSVNNNLKSRKEVIRNSSKYSNVRRLTGKNKQKWVSEHKLLHGSLQEGLGFAFKRKEKVKHEYNKLRRKQHQNKMEKTFLTEKYPEHLEHLYLAEEQRQREEELKKKHDRTESRSTTVGEEEEFCPGNDRISTAADQSSCPGQTNTSLSASTLQPDRKKKSKMTSYNRTKEHYTKQQEERERKKEQYQKNAAAKEEAIRKYKEKKKATYQLLKKKTKKGQPNLNAQMELLLQKIQGTNK